MLKKRKEVNMNGQELRIKALLEGFKGILSGEHN